MKLNLLVIGVVLFLATGLDLIFSFCRGTVGFSGGIPVANSAFTINITTTGIAGLSGVALTAIGAMLLIVALIAAILGLFRRTHAAEKIAENPPR